MILLIIMLMYYLIVFGAIKESDSINFLKKMSKKEIVINFFLIFFLIFIAYSIIIRENFIYYWDYSTYWRRALEAINLYNNSWIEVLKKVLNTINYDDYNMLQGLLIALPLKMLGYKYLSYILVVLIMFFIPTCVIIMLIMQSIFYKYLHIEVKSYYFFGGCLLFIWFWHPILNGFADIAGVLMISLTFLLTFSFDFLEFKPKKDILISITLLLSMILRRYFAYWVLGYSGALFILILLKLIKIEKKEKFLSLIKVIKNLLFIYGFLVLTLVIFFRLFLVRSIFNNYNVAYQAYNTTDLFNKLFEFIQYLGVYTIFFIFILIYSIYKKKFVDEIVFLLCSVMFSLFSFYRTQNMSIQHYYIISVQVLIIIMLGLGFWIGVRWKASKLFIIMGAIIYAMNFLHGISLLPDSLQKNEIWSQKTYKSKQRNDMDEIQLLKKRLKELTPNYEGIYTIGSSGVMTSDILICSYLPNLNPDVNIIPVPQVDLRDGFSTSFFDAKVIVCTSPAQYHLSPEFQRVIGILTDEFEDNSSIIKDNYDMDNSYLLDNGVRADVYVKKDNFSKDEIEYLSNKYEKYYFNYPDLFRNRFMDYIESNFK